MGASAVCITREEFVTPPEFEHQKPTLHATARVGGARLELVRRGDETELGGCYQQIPIWLMPPFSFPQEPASLLYLITLTAGLMDGDGHLFELVAREGTRAVVTGQSATRIHPATASFATQQWDVVVEENACLVVLPGPAIPFRDARLFQRGRVALALSSRLLWGDIWLAGRYDRGELSERFRFDRIVQDFEVRRGPQRVYRDRFCWEGPWNASDAAWYFGGQLASASLFVGGPLPPRLSPPRASVRRAIFPLESGDSCVRWCGHPMEVTADVVRLTLEIAGQWTGGDGAPPWLLESSSLSPNHWFSAPPEAPSDPPEGSDGSYGAEGSVRSEASD